MLHFFLKRKRFFFFFLLTVLCVALITLGVDKKQKQLPAQTALQTFFSYPLSLTSWIVTTTSSLWEGYIHLVDVEKRNIELQQEMDLLLLENQQLREHFFENQRLKILLDFKQQFSYTMLPAEIIGKDPSSWFKTILVTGEPRPAYSAAAVLFLPWALSEQS